MQGIDIICETKKRGWTQDRIAMKAGMSRQALWKILHDRTQGGIKAAKAVEIIAEILNVRPEQIKDWYNS